MSMSREQVLQIAAEFRRSLEQLYRDRLRAFYLYGSYARGDADDDSDIDIAVVLQGPVRAAEERRRTSLIRGDLSLRHRCVVMPLFVSEDELLSGTCSVYRSIAREGVPA